MSTLLLRFAAPLQSWGSDSKFEVRRTELFPTKSGIVGFIASALGRSRDDDLEDLRNLNVGIRVDNPGTVIRDFHTARFREDKPPYISTRYYLSDAIFLVGIESENEELLETIANAIRHPAFPLFLGRRSCPPTLPIVLGIHDDGLKPSLENQPCLSASRSKMYSNRDSRIIMDAPSPLFGTAIRDNPISFSKRNRQFGVRFIEEIPFTFENESNTPLEHDAFGAVEEN
ncbi:MAG: type I-E CRISPR-associated protein Cas5/CasD [Erysipelotrichaceae bacterium]|nr:type I-E CRISPR-associated protein Cas5/CasD [Erysipelotrichaceae bacterium]